MMKTRLLILTMLVCLLVFYSATLADMLQDDIQALRQAGTFDAQLAVLNKTAAENAAELESDGWENSYTVTAAPGLPGHLIPEDWDKLTFTETDSLPDAMRGRKFIALYCAGNSAPEFAGDLLARMPAEMRAASLAEAEYALIVRWHKVESGIKYIISTTSYHRDYEAYAVDLKTGESVRFWAQRNGAKGSGKINALDGDLFSQQELWTILRAYVYRELRHELADGSMLVFGVTGENCYLKRAELAEGATELVIPGEVEGYTVTEIAKKCLMSHQTLRSVVLSEGLKRISDSAFYNCTALESVTLPDTLEIIGEEAFRACSSLRQIELPASLRTLGRAALMDNPSIRRMMLPGSIGEIRRHLLAYCDTLARVVVGEGITGVSERALMYSDNIACIYFPASLTSGLFDAELTKSAVIYAPEGSRALTWAKENGYECVVCPGPDAMPPVEYFIEGDFEFRTFRGEVALSAYLGSGANVVVPENAGGVPVTCVLPHAIDDLSHVESVTLPQSVRTVRFGAICAHGGSNNRKVSPFHLYVSSPETAFEEGSVRRYGGNETTVTIHAPEGSAAQRYVTETTDEPLAFEPWGEGVDPDARSVSDAVALAGQVQESIASFWQTCDRKEYAWLGRIPDYNMSAPNAAAVLRVTQQQFDELTVLMGNPGNVAASFAYIVNTQFSLPYARAAAKTAQTAQVDPVADGSCAFVVLCYQTDIVFAALDGHGNAQAALICSSPKIIEMISPDYVQEIAAQQGVMGGACTVFREGELSALLKRSY